MQIETKFDNNILPNKYSKHAEEIDKYKDIPITSFPFEIKNAPKETKYFCITLIDHDAIPICGFSWIHWTVANIPVEQTNIPENYSQDINYKKVQGVNSFSSLIANETDEKIIRHYAGPTPPDRDHKYTLTVYAISEAIDLKDGFYLNELYDIIDEITIECTELIVIGKD